MRNNYVATVNNVCTPVLMYKCLSQNGYERASFNLGNDKQATFGGHEGTRVVAHA